MTTPPRKPGTDDSSIKETLQSITVAFILAFVFRAFVVEAFVIPTGSMAPTLLGKHVKFTCPECGYRFTGGPRDYPGNNSSNEPLPIQGRQSWRDRKTGARFERTEPLSAHCPMCDYPITKDWARLDAGDRILVLKYIYAFSEPRRWDVVVFRPPDNPGINYIKRLVGLPDEWLRIIRGNVFTSTDQGQSWHIQRKPVKVQQAVWQPVYHSAFEPLDDGQSLNRRSVWTTPWQPVNAENWAAENRGRTLTFHPAAADRQGDESGTNVPGAGVLRFDFERHPWATKDYSAYNNLAIYSLRDSPVFVEDMRVGLTVLPHATGGEVTLHIGGELLDYQGAIRPDGSIELRIAPGGAKRTERTWTTVAQAPGQPLAADQTHRVELWCVDQSAQLWVDGEMALKYDIPVADQTDDQSPFVLSVRTLLAHNEIGEPPRISVTLGGAAMDVRDIDLDRDLYYTNPTHESTSLATYDNVAKLADNEFFCLGDNSPASADGRRWKSVNDWVTYHTRFDHHHLGPEGEELPGVGNGIVPRRLMIGRAFFVYWPAPDRLSPNDRLWMPNFGDLRFIH
ncbi:MAG: S26 family signal peptidase [Phycisphaeraceae bacterium]